jgi:HEAT repeat protein
MAISSLGRFGVDASTAIPAIVRLLQDPDEYVRRFATNALCDIEPHTFKRLRS